MNRVRWATGEGQVLGKLYATLNWLNAESAFLYTSCELSDRLAASNDSELRRKCSKDGLGLSLEMALHRERAAGISAIESD